MRIDTLTVAVLGGSIGGLSAAALLHRAGADVHIYERSTEDLGQSGGGLGVDLALVSRITGERPHTALPHLALGARRVVASGRPYDEPSRIASSGYGLVQRHLRQQIPDERYHAGVALCGLSAPDAGEHGVVRVTLTDGSSLTPDLVIGADGYRSTARSLLLGQEMPARYAGYVLWRGVIAESELLPATRAALTNALHVVPGPRRHLVAYPVPGADGSTEPGQRRWNWGWYAPASWEEVHEELLVDRHGQRKDGSLGFGECQEAHLTRLAALAADWPSPYTELIRESISANRVGLYPVRELEPQHMAFGRACLLGDAAHLASPITGSGARMAMEDALALAASLEAAASVDQALAAYQHARLRVTRAIVAQGHAAASPWRWYGPEPRSTGARSELRV